MCRRRKRVLRKSAVCSKHDALAYTTVLTQVVGRDCRLVRVRVFLSYHPHSHGCLCRYRERSNSHAIYRFPSAESITAGIHMASLAGIWTASPKEIRGNGSHQHERFLGKALRRKRLSPLWASRSGRVAVPFEKTREKPKAESMLAVAKSTGPQYGETNGKPPPRRGPCPPFPE